MISSSLPRLARKCAILAVLTCLLQVSCQADPVSALPTISKIWFDGADVVVTVSVPDGVRKVTLESRTRLGAGSWVPRAVSRLDGTAAELTFRLPKSAQVEILRVRTDAEEVLPASFYQGTNAFVAGAATADPALAPGPAVDTGAERNGGTTGTTREVVESDIWKFEGNTLYFFNQYRGLQVIDLTVPDAPVITGTYSLPAAGEQMYVVEGTHVVLLAQSGCGSDGQVVVLDVSGGTPKPAASLRVPGWIQESRMVGNALYVASQAYQPVPGSKESQWEWGSTISSFDLSNPTAPATKDTLWYAGYGNVIYATDRHLFVATQSTSNWWQSIVRCIDISAPDGAMKALASITVAGRVPDKFKLNESGDVLSVISENWNNSGGGVVTVLETFSLADPTVPQKLGSLLLAPREQLHATRFDGDRVYVVTFFRVDPLWIVDLSDPVSPRVAGELHVPGWSTYIEPLGDRLVAIGINDTNDWRVAVSLFDVHDPAQPSLLDKVPLGVNQSWSEATSDEKAFSVLPDAGLILVPYQGYETNGYASRVQLIDLGADTLKARGTIEHAFQPRRATLHQDRIYSISGKELLAVDATDRDHPVVRADVELSWSVDRVFLAGEYLVEIANGDSWAGWWSQGTVTPPSIRVARTSEPERPLTTLVLTNYLPVIGATLREDKLYLAQGVTSYGWPVVGEDGSKTETDPTNAPSLFTSVLDLSHLPEVTVLGQTGVVTEPLGWNPSLQAVWPSAGLLVWSGGSGGWGPWMFDGLVRGGVAGVAGGRGIWWPYWRSGGGRLLAFDVSTPSTPQWLSEVNLSTNSWWSFSSAFTANGLVYLGHQSSEFIEGVTLPGQAVPAPVVTVDKTTGEVITNEVPVGIWVTRYYLDVIDYGDPKVPTVRSPVNIPGQLQGISHGGALLYTVAPHWTNWVTDWADWLDASAYDGVSASLVDSLPMPKDWPHPLVVNGSTVFLSRPDSAASTSRLESWTLADNGKFTQVGAVEVGSVSSTLMPFGLLLAAQQNNGGVVVFEATNPAALVAVGKGQPEGCLWFDLTQGDASRAEGLWLPLADYGLFQVSLSP